MHVHLERDVQGSLVQDCEVCCNPPPRWPHGGKCSPIRGCPHGAFKGLLDSWHARCLAYPEAFMKYKNLIVIAALGVVFAVVAIAQERTPPMSPTPSAMGTSTPSVMKLETITPSATPPMAGTPPMSGKPARRRRTPGAQMTPTAPYSTTPAPSPVMTAPSMTPVPPGR